ncbi:type VII toxin-antitoxin system HepT family RNase toxin [Thalassiella azotivora]
MLRLLRSVSDEVSFLRDEAQADDARRADPMWLRGVKYAFVSSIEACIDVAQHLCSSEGWGPPSDNGDAMTVISQHGVLDREHARAMRQAVGFRNVLVHEYVRVDDDVVTARLADLSDLERFMTDVAAFVGGEEHDAV